ncbi:hypothetical protein TRIHO_05780 [Tritonibacter horizontis]|uniref:Uncharacterized protein n=1 Tax=Tritonibacter horizontis TaxID=1768241 RepID=A0A132C353_9RHOB|nr:hypothetical protein TRIHO_05780 [Tritonibacter horizontis]
MCENAAGPKRFHIFCPSQSGPRLDDADEPLAVRRGASPPPLSVATAAMPCPSIQRATRNAVKAALAMPRAESGMKISLQPYFVE